MNYIKSIVLIFSIFFSIQATNAAYTDLDIKTIPQNNKIHAFIISSKTDEVALTNNRKENETVLNSLSANSNTAINSRRQNNNYFSSFNGCMPRYDKQFSALIDYLYSKSYLDNKSKTTISLLLFQIQPNAP